MAARLHSAHGSDEVALGNQADPLDQAIYTLLGFQTDVPRQRAVWGMLKDTFPEWEQLERAKAHQVAAVIKPAGLHRQKARVILSLLSSVRREAGELSLDQLRSMDDAQAEHFLLRLPGMSWKGARCVLLYALDRAVFPVDVNTFRIFKRTRLITPTEIYRRKYVHDSLQRAVPAELRRPLHVNLVHHGRQVCRPRGPACSNCPLSRMCPKVDIPTETPHGIH